jgi:hypothetical protein
MLEEMRYKIASGGVYERLFVFHLAGDGQRPGRDTPADRALPQEDDPADIDLS